MPGPLARWGLSAGTITMTKQDERLSHDDYLRALAAYMRDPSFRIRKGKGAGEIVITIGPVMAEQVALHLEDIASDIEDCKDDGK